MHAVVDMFTQLFYRGFGCAAMYIYKYINAARLAHGRVAAVAIDSEKCKKLKATVKKYLKVRNWTWKDKVKILYSNQWPARKPWPSPRCHDSEWHLFLSQPAHSHRAGGWGRSAGHSSRTAIVGSQCA